VAQHITLRLSGEMATRLAGLGAKTGLTRTDLIRLAIDQYLDFHAGRSVNLHRLAEITEFCQLALDQWLRQAAPEQRGAIIDAVIARMDEFHAG
jgi:predicted transcriptional regulator